jgi:hypothetical protein
MDSGTVSYTVTVAPVAGFTGTVLLAAPGLPVSASSNLPATISIASSRSVTYAMTVTAPSSGAGSLTVTANGTSGSLRHSAVSTLNLQDFTVALSPYNVSSPPVIAYGATQTFTVSAAGLNGYAGYVQLAQPGTAGTCQFSAWNLPSQVQAGYAVTTIITPSVSLQPGQTVLCSVQINASVNGDSHALIGAFYVSRSSSPTFSFALPVAQGTQTATPATQAATVTFAPTLTPSNFCSSTITFQVTGLPAGATASPQPAALCNSPLTEQVPITVAPGTAPGTYPLTISASGVNSGGGQTATQYVNPICWSAAARALFR